MEKWICADHFTDKYIKSYIEEYGECRQCDFCSDECENACDEKCISIEDLVKLIKPIVDEEYPRAEEDGEWDSETREYMDDIYTIDDVMRDFISLEIGCEDEDILDEMKEFICPDIRISKDSIEETQAEEDASEWDLFSDLINKTDFRPEQIVYEMESDNTEGIFKQIKDYLDMALDFIKNFAPEYILLPSMPVYRAVNYLNKDFRRKYKCNKLNASMIGTPVPIYELNSDNRMSDKGGMVFYGAPKEEVSLQEVAKGFDDYVVGEFHVDKEVSLLNLSTLYGSDKPSIFDQSEDSKNNREIWLFVKHFMENISSPHIQDLEKSYKPTQVFSSYIQRETNYSGIVYPSSKYTVTIEQDGTIQGEICYALYVDHWHCIDKGRKPREDSLNLIMESNPKIYINVCQPLNQTYGINDE